MSESTIRFTWPWGYIWTVMSFALLGWLLWAFALADALTAAFGARCWYSGWAALEMAGAYQNSHKENEPEAARTLSQLMQLIAQKSNDGAKWWQSWNAAAAGYAVLLAVAAALAFWPVGPFVHGVSIVGALFGLTVLCWTLFHFVRRNKYG